MSFPEHHGSVLLQKDPFFLNDTYNLHKQTCENVKIGDADVANHKQILEN